MRTSTSIFLLVLLLTTGCQLVDSNPNWDPSKELPAWTYDAPWYYRPSEDVQAREKVGPEIPIYYCRSEKVFVVHPGGYQVSGVPRLAVWVSNNQGRRTISSRPERTAATGSASSGPARPRPTSHEACPTASTSWIASGRRSRSS